MAAAAGGAFTLSTLRSMTDDLPEGRPMPALFMGHGSPMNAIEDNEFSKTWEQLGTTLPTPAAVLVVSAHWLTRGTRITAMEHPRTIHDFGGFPQALFDVQYPAPGNPELAEETRRLLSGTEAVLDHDWGLDHGTWSVIKRMYPKADIPVLQLSIDYNRPAQYHYDLARGLAPLRRKGVLIVGSGNMVHNLRMVAWDKLDAAGFGFDWALEMNETFKRKISARDHAALIAYDSLGSGARLAIPTPDHYYPLLYVLGLQEKNDEPAFLNDRAVAGALTMTSVRLG